MLHLPSATVPGNRPRRLLLAMRSLFAVALMASALAAADIAVTTDSDSGAGSLRQGLANSASGDRLVFDSALNGTTLANGSALVVTQPVSFFDSNSVATSIILTDSHAYTLAQPLTINWAGTLNLNGVLSDGGSAGSLIKQGPGTLALSGANSFTGGVTLEGGTLALQNNSALGTGVLVVNNQGGNTILDAANGVTINNDILLKTSVVINSAAGTSSQYGGAISETGGSFGITTSGTGTLIFSGPNSFSGGIYVGSDSTITALSNAALGTGTVNESGALTLNLANGVNLGNHFLLGNHFVANVDSGTATMSGVIDEYGGYSAPFNKTGAGTLIFSNANTYTGTTTVSAGNLQVQGSITSDVTVDSSGTLSGTGTVGNVDNSGIVQPGNSGIGTLTVHDFTQQSAGTTKIQIDSAGNSALINASGHAALDGTLNVTAIGGGTFTNGTQYTILNATNGVSGVFSNVMTNLPFFNVGVTYDPNDVFITLQRTGGLGTIGSTTNQRAVGGVLDTIYASGSGSVYTMVNTLGTETTGQQQQALNQLSGEIFGTTQSIGLQAGDQFQRTLTTRIISNGQLLTGSESAEPDELVRGQSPTQSVRTWVAGFGVNGRMASDGNAAGTNFSQGGLAFGADLGSDETGVIGITGGTSFVGFREDYAGSGHMTSYQTGLYAVKHNEIGYVLGTATYAYDAFNTSRSISPGGVNQTLQANYGGNQFGAYAETGLKYNLGLVHLQPLIGLQYLYLAQQGFSESGGPAALNVSAAQADSLRTSLGGRLIVDQFTGPHGAIWTPYWHLRWISELLSDDRIINASFNGAPIGGTFATHGDQLGRNFGIFGKGVNVQLSDNWSLFGNIDLMFGGHFHSETGTGGLLYTW